MATIVNKPFLETRFPGINNSILQESPTWLDILDAMAANDVTTYTFPEASGDPGLPPVVEATRYTGGDITNTMDANWNVNNGDTIIFQIDAADGQGFVQYSHALTGVTNGAATAAQVAASINGDAVVGAIARAAAGLTANRVTVQAQHPRGALRVIGGTAQTTILFPGTTGDNKARVYVSQSLDKAGGTGYTWSYDTTTRILTVKNESGGTVNRTLVRIRR